MFLLIPHRFHLIRCLTLCVLLQTTSPVASLFISLHHNVSGVEPTREAPKGEPFFYEAGWKDGCAVFFYSLVCIVMHAILQEYFLDVSYTTPDLVFLHLGSLFHYYILFLENIKEVSSVEVSIECAERVWAAGGVPTGHTAMGR